jgi:DNA-binding transcriptional MerR regulator
MPSRELVKLYSRIGEVSEIVGVQPHVLRYWETEFRSIRPQKSSKGQRVYSRRDVEKLLRVKDLLRNQGFTIAGARKRLSEPAVASEAAASEEAVALQAVALQTVALQSQAEEAPVVESQLPAAKREAKDMRQVLLGLRQDLMGMLAEISVTKGA